MFRSKQQLIPGQECFYAATMIYERVQVPTNLDARTHAPDPLPGPVTLEANSSVSDQGKNRSSGLTNLGAQASPRHENLGRLRKDLQVFNEDVFNTRWRTELHATDAPDEFIATTCDTRSQLIGI